MKISDWRATAGLLAMLLLVFPAGLVGQGVVRASLRAGPSFSLGGAPQFDLWGGEVAIGLRLGRHTSLAVMAGATPYDRSTIRFDGFYDPATGGVSQSCPDPCTDTPIVRESRDTDRAQFAALVLRLSPGSGRVTKPWIDLGLGFYRLGERFEDHLTEKATGATAFDSDHTSWGWGAGASLGVGSEWYPRQGGVGLSVGARLHGALAKLGSDLTGGVFLQVGAGVAWR